MTTASDSGRAELLASVADLAERLAHLAHNVETVVARAEARRQQCETVGARPEARRQQSAPVKGAKSKPRKADRRAAAHEDANGLVEEAAIPLSPIGEPTLVQSKATGSQESLLATGISDLYERLGGFLTASFQPPSEDAPAKNADVSSR